MEAGSLGWRESLNVGNVGNVSTFVSVSGSFEPES